MPCGSQIRFQKASLYEPTIAERPPTPSFTELKTAIDKGDSVSVMDLAQAVKSEGITPEKPPVKKPKKSIKARIEADKAEKSAAAEKSAPTTHKKKGETEL